MTDDFVDRLLATRYAQIVELHEKIEELQETIARIEYTNLRRDMNIKNRTLEIDKLCRTK